MSEHAQPEMHPDLDALSAFAEGGLAEHERLACLDHLAACAECREIVYLTQAAEAAEEKPLGEPKPDAVPFWKRWLRPVPILSAAAVAALVATSLVIYRHQTPPAPQPGLMAKVETPPAAIPAPEPVQPRAVRPKARVPMSVPLMPKLVSPSAAPSQLAGVAGTATDPASAAVAKAQVNLTESAGANSFTPSTTGSGQYSVPGVPPGQSDLSAGSLQFRRTQNEIQLQPAPVARADSVLTSGNVPLALDATEQLSVQMPAGRGGRGGARAGRAPAALVAPTIQKPALLSAASGKISLRTDASGALSRSTNAGKSWKNVKARWQGNIIRLATPPDAPGGGDAVFQLNTDTGEIWFSRDGNRWTAAPAH